MFKFQVKDLPEFVFDNTTIRFAVDYVNFTKADMDALLNSDPSAVKKFPVGYDFGDGHSCVMQFNLKDNVFTFHTFDENGGYAPVDISMNYSEHKTEIDKFLSYMSNQ